MHVKKITECSWRTSSNTFDIYEATICLYTFVLSIFEWPLKKGFTVFHKVLRTGQFNEYNKQHAVIVQHNLVLDVVSHHTCSLNCKAFYAPAMPNDIKVVRSVES